MEVGIFILKKGLRRSVKMHNEDKVIITRFKSINDLEVSLFSTIKKMPDSPDGILIDVGELELDGYKVQKMFILGDGRYLMVGTQLKPNYRRIGHA